MQRLRDGQNPLPARLHAQLLTTLAERPNTYSVSLHISGGKLRMHVPAADAREAAQFVSDFLTNGPEWNDDHETHPLPWPWRAVETTEAGRDLLTVFRADWVSGFDVVDE